MEDGRRNEYITGITAILIGIVGVATIAVLVSPGAQTAGVIGAGAGGFATDLTCALSPVTGGNCSSAVKRIGVGITWNPLGQ